MGQAESLTVDTHEFPGCTPAVIPIIRLRKLQISPLLEQLTPKIIQYFIM